MLAVVGFGVGQDQTYVVSEAVLYDSIIPMGSPSYQDVEQYVSGYVACTNIYGVISKSNATGIPGGINSHNAWECSQLEWVIVGNGAHHIEPSSVLPGVGYRFNSSHGTLWQSLDSVYFFGLGI
jgi:hypothetical protein